MTPGSPSTGTFGLRQDHDRWRLTDPDGNPFFSLGVNHADESNLKYPVNIDVWRRRYGSRESWIRDGVVADLSSWHFNTIGWTAECVSLSDVEINDWDARYDAKHSGGWNRDDFTAAGMPYCIALPVAPIEGWNLHPAYPDVFSKEWADWCAYLGRSVVAEHAEDPNLIGYFYVDVPAWLPHPSGAFFPGVDEADGSAALAAVAHRYYKTMHTAIRQYDSRHLILGDRYNGNMGIPSVVIDAMVPYVDVLSVQYFTEPTAQARSAMRDDLAGWQAQSGKPVLIADIGNWCATAHNPQRKSSLADQASRGDDYVAAFEAVLDEPWLVGWHWCSYSENFSRGWGLKDPLDEPYEELLSKVTKFNASVPARVRPT